MSRENELTHPGDKMRTSWNSGKNSTTKRYARTNPHTHTASQSVLIYNNVVIIQTMKTKLMRLWSTIFCLSLKICHSGEWWNGERWRSTLLKIASHFIHAATILSLSFQFYNRYHKIYNLARCKRIRKRKYTTPDTEFSHTIHVINAILVTCRTLIHAVLSSKYCSPCAYVRSITNINMNWFR